MRWMAVKLLAVPASHPCAAVEAMLKAKGVRYERVDLVPALSRLWLRMTGFDAATVPALRLDGVRVQGSRAIARALDASWPDPPLFPVDPDARARVEQMEAWADGPLQEVTRRIVLWALLRSPPAVRAALEGARLQFRIPARIAAAVAPPVLRVDARLHGARDSRVRADVASLPGMLDHADEWAARARASMSSTAADYQLAGSVRLLLTLDDLADVFAGRPVADLARRLIPAFRGHVPAGTLPAAWLR
jgi:glutathione S-transferase